MRFAKTSLFLILFLFINNIAKSQNDPYKLHFLETPDSLHKPRFWVSASSGAAIYTGFTIGLWNVWYKDYPTSSFHTFNDWGEWENFDKIGHLYSAWVQSSNVFQGARWTGMKRKKAMWTAAASGMLMQGTFEIMDGFSEKWGFSWGDVAFNTLGIGLFMAQELAWEEQRFILKVSASPQNYSTDPIFSIDGDKSTDLATRADELYGSSPFNVLIKDYNAQTLWLSATPRSFLKNRAESKLPKWLNLSLGYGVGNIYGGFRNEWPAEAPEFILDPNAYQRYHQFYLSFDVDLSKLPVKNRWLKLMLGLVNWIKIPAPTLEMNTLGKMKFHPIYW